MTTAKPASRVRRRRDMKRTIVIAVLITILDYGMYAPFFEWINVLEAGS